MDVDLSVDGEIENVERLKSRLLNTLETTFAEDNYVVFDFIFEVVPPNLSDDMKDFWGGYRAMFKIIERRKFDKLKDDPNALRGSDKTSGQARKPG